MSLSHSAMKACVSSCCRREILRNALVVVGSCVTLTISLGGQLGAQQSAPTGFISLRNASWDVVRVQMTRPKGNSCSAGLAGGTITLKRGHTWSIRASGPICWRRESQPGQTDAGWTAWQQLTPSATANAVSDIP